MEKREKRYTAWCGRCYSCYLKQTNSKCDAWRAAAGHAHAFPGHPVDVTDNVEVARRKAERDAIRAEMQATSTPAV
jgi:hypothetical protein